MFLLLNLYPLYLPILTSLPFLVVPLYLVILVTFGWITKLNVVPLELNALLWLLSTKLAPSLPLFLVPGSPQLTDPLFFKLFDDVKRCICDVLKSTSRLVRTQEWCPFVRTHKN